MKFLLVPFATSIRTWALAALLILATVAGGVLFHFQGEIIQRLGNLLAWVSGFGSATPILYVALYVTTTVLMLPAFPLKLGAGFLFGFWKGAFMALCAGTLAASAAFLTGRFLARNWVSQRLASFPRFQRLDAAVAREGWKIVLLGRLSVILPYNLLNYGLGLTDVSLKTFASATWIGMIPLTLVYTWLGSMAHDLTALSETVKQPGSVPGWLYGIGLTATIGITVFLARLAQQIMREKDI